MTFLRGFLCSAAAAVAVLGVSGLLASPAAAVGLLGQNMGVGYYIPDTSSLYAQAVFTPSSFTVGAGQETDGNVEDVTHLLVDFDAGSLTITLTTVLSNPTWNNTAFNGIIFTSALDHGIGGASVDGSTTMSGFDSSRVSFTNDQILINWGGLSYTDGTSVKVNFTFDTPVPEPGSGLLVGGGLLGVALARRKRS